MLVVPPPTFCKVPEIERHLPVVPCDVTVSTTDVWFEMPLQVPTMLAGHSAVAEAPEAARHPATIASAAIGRSLNMVISITNFSRQRLSRHPTIWVKQAVMSFAA